MSIDAPSCRICFDSGDTEPLVAPCKCAGTQRFIHKSCLRQWIATNSSMRSANPYHPLRTFVCSVCQSTYRHFVPRKCTYSSYLWLVALCIIILFSYAYELVFMLATTCAAAAMMKLELSFRMEWESLLPRIDLVRLVPEGSLLQTTKKVQFGMFQDTKVIVISNSSSKGAVALILNRPKTILGERVHMGVIATQGPDAPQSIHILHRSADIGGRELVPGLFYGGCYLSLLAYPEILRCTYYGEARWPPYALEEELSQGFWRVLGLADPEMIVASHHL